eukprot:UN29192
MMTLVPALYLFSFVLTSDVIETEVIIVGGGMAGVTAGYTLSEHDMNDFILLEAQDKLGGRMDSLEITLQDGSTLVIEDGANWIAGPHEDNPIYHLATKYGLEYVEDDYDSIKFMDDGRTLDTTDDDIRWYDWSGADEALDELAQSYIENDKPDISFRTAMEKLGWSPSKASDRLVEWFEIDFEWGMEPEYNSLKNNLPEHTFVQWGSNNDLFVNDQRGYAYILEQLACEYFECDANSMVTDERLHLNSEVISIDQTNSEYVEVITRSGEVFHANHVIVTVSAGCMAHETITFSPPLSAEKQYSIQHLNPTELDGNMP